jgi:hypothetical protein
MQYEALAITPGNDSFGIDWRFRIGNACDCNQRFSFMLSQAADARNTSVLVSGEPLRYALDNGNVYFDVDFAPYDTKSIRISYETAPAALQFNLNGWAEPVRRVGISVSQAGQSVYFSEQPQRLLDGASLWDFENVPKGKTFGVYLQRGADFGGVAALAALFVVALLLLAAEKKHARAARRKRR